MRQGKLQCMPPPQNVILSQCLRIRTCLPHEQTLAKRCRAETICRMENQHVRPKLSGSLKLLISVESLDQGPQATAFFCFHRGFDFQTCGFPWRLQLTCSTSKTEGQSVFLQNPNNLTGLALQTPDNKCFLEGFLEGACEGFQ